MAIGARISSENLSGKTATVTFTPYTGQTSGSTVNLGTKTIPFNNITTHPYGDYAIYLPEYDYTYTLNIPEPVLDTQLYVVVDRNVNDNNYGFATFNYNDFTATVLDFGVDTNQWQTNDVYPLQNSGFGYEFAGDNNWQDRLVIFTDASNTEIGRYSGNTNCFNFNNLNGRWNVFTDCQNGIITYSDGVSVYTYTYDSGRYSIDIQWDYDATFPNKSFIIAKYDEGQGIDHHALLFKADGTQALIKSWENGIDYNFQFQYNSDFLVIEKWDNNSNTYTQLEILDSDLNILETILLSGTTYNNRNYGFHGTNKYFAVYWDNNDVNTAYKIIHYNYSTTTLIDTSHARGNEYQWCITRYDSDLWPQNHSNKGLVISFGSESGFGWTNWGLSMNYYDIMYMLDGLTQFGTYTYANDQTRFIDPYITQKSDIIRFKSDDGNGNGVNGNACVLTITSGTTNNVNLSIPITNINWTDYSTMDNRIVFGISGDDSGITLLLIDSNGNVQDAKEITYAVPWGENQSRGQNKTYYFGCNAQNDGYIGWYVNDTTTGFTQTEYYHWQNTSDNYFKSDFRRNSDIVLYNFVNNTARVLRADGISTQIQTPQYNNDRGIEVGEDMFMFYYNDPDTSAFHIKLYDFSGNTVTTVDTPYTDRNMTLAVKDRFLMSFWDNNNSIYVYYMLGLNGENHVSLGDFNRYDMANDYVWWD